MTDTDYVVIFFGGVGGLGFVKKFSLRQLWSQPLHILGRQPILFRLDHI